MLDNNVMQSSNNTTNIILNEISDLKKCIDDLHKQRNSLNSEIGDLIKSQQQSKIEFSQTLKNKIVEYVKKFKRIDTPVLARLVEIDEPGILFDLALNIEEIELDKEYYWVMKNNEK